MMTASAPCDMRYATCNRTPVLARDRCSEEKKKKEKTEKGKERRRDKDSLTSYHDKLSPYPTLLPTFTDVWSKLIEEKRNKYST